MATDESKKHRIMELAFKKFISLGIPHVTMDDISRGVGIGKGTLYKFFPSKEQLILDTVDFVIGHVEKEVVAIMNDEKITPTEKLGRLIKTIAGRLSLVNPSAFSYLERAVPEAYDKIVESRKRIILTNFVKLIEEGKKSGHFEPDLDSYLVAHIFIGAIDHIIENEVLSTLDYSLDTLFRSVTTTVLKGCLTEEGRREAFKSEGAR